MKNILISIIACVIAIVAMVVAFLPNNVVDGKDGINGVDGKDGVTPIIEISDDGYWVINGEKTDVKAEAEKNENPQGLDFYPLPDGTYGVKAGKAICLEEIIIPAEYNGKKVTQILEKGFSGCYYLKSVEIPENVECIGYRAFADCPSLESIEISSSVKTIYCFSFDNCPKLSSIKFKGTIQQCKSIEFINSWTSPSGGSHSISFVPWYSWHEVICSDGTIN